MSKKETSMTIRPKSWGNIPNSPAPRSCRVRAIRVATRAASLLAATVAILSCNSKTALTRRDAALPDSGGEIGMAVDEAEESEDVGRTMTGVYTCCAPNEGTECCVGIAQGLCYRYGGTAGRCLKEGELSDGKDICTVCCSGLSRVSPDIVSETGTECQSTDTPSTLICVRCGDGVCDEFENRCRCLADCP